MIIGWHSVDTTIEWALTQPLCVPNSTTVMFQIFSMIFPDKPVRSFATYKLFPLCFLALSFKSYTEYIFFLRCFRWKVLHTGVHSCQLVFNIELRSSAVKLLHSEPVTASQHYRCASYPRRWIALIAAQTKI